MLAFLGTSAGGLVGVMVADATAERWQPAALDGSRVGVRVTPSAQGVALRVTTRY